MYIHFCCFSQNACCINLMFMFCFFHGYQIKLIIKMVQVVYNNGLFYVLYVVIPIFLVFNILSSKLFCNLCMYLILKMVVLAIYNLLVSIRACL